MALVRMELTAEQAKESTGAIASDGSAPKYLASDGSAPKYPHGLRISLDSDSLENLGVKSLPAVGTKLLVTAVVEVSSTSERQQQDGTSEKSADLQITEMELSSPPSDIASRLYK